MQELHKSETDSKSFLIRDKAMKSLYNKKDNNRQEQTNCS